MKKRAAVLLAEGFEETEAVTVIDVLRRADVEVHVLGVGQARIVGSHGIVIEADRPLAQAQGPFDAVILPGGMPGAATLRDSDAVKSFVVAEHARGAVTAAICAAPIALGRFGLLKDKQATCYPGFEQQLTGAHVEVRPVVVDGNIITSRGVGTALKFSLTLVERLTNAETRATLAERMLVP